MSNIPELKANYAKLLSANLKKRLGLKTEIDADSWIRILTPKGNLLVGEVRIEWAGIVGIYPTVFGVTYPETRQKIKLICKNTKDWLGQS
jgi:hypothetical protein